MHIIKAKYDGVTDTYWIDCGQGGNDNNTDTASKCLECNCFINAFKNDNNIYITCGEEKTEVSIKKEKIRKLIDKLENELSDIL